MFSLQGVLVCVLVSFNPDGGIVKGVGRLMCVSLQRCGITPLHAASLKGHDAVVAALLASGAAVNQTRTVCVPAWNIMMGGRVAICRAHAISCSFVSHIGDVCALSLLMIYLPSRLL